MLKKSFEILSMIDNIFLKYNLMILFDFIFDTIIFKVDSTN